MKKNLFIGRVTGKRVFKTAPTRYMTYIHVEPLKTTDINANGFSQIECDFNLLKKVRNLKSGDLIFAEFTVIRKDIHKGRPRNTIQATNICIAKKIHFKKIDLILKDG